MSEHVPQITSLAENVAQSPYGEIISTELKAWLIHSMCIGCSILLLIIHTGTSLPVELALIPLFVFNLITLAWIVINYSKKEDTVLLRMQHRELVCVIANFIFKSLLVFHLQYSVINIAIVGAPLYLSNVVCIFVRNKSKIECQNTAYSLKFCSRWVLSLSFLLGSLRINQVVSWNWHFVFWPTYGVVLILLIVSIGEIFLITSLIVKCATGKANCLDLICPFWLLYTTLGSAMSLCFTFYTLGNVFEENDIEILSPALGLTILFLIGFAIYTFIFFDHIVRWFDIFFNSRYFDVPLSSPNLNNLQRQVGFASRIAVLFKDPPKFLKRISSTFYRPTTEEEVKTIKRVSSHPISFENNEEMDDIKFNSSMIQENSDIDSTTSEKLCIICCVERQNAVIMECGHAGICFKCGEELVQKGNTCIICRDPIGRVLEIKEQSNNVVSVIGVSPSLPVN